MSDEGCFVVDTGTGNVLLFEPSLDQAKRAVEELFCDPTGLVVRDPEWNAVFTYHGPLVTP